MSRSILLLLSLATLLLPTREVAAQDRALPMLVSAEWLANELDESDLVVINVDQRRDDYEAGHIPGASHLPYSDITVDIGTIRMELPPIDQLGKAFLDAGVRDGSRVVIYGSPLTAARAWMTLDYLGMGSRAAILDGGITAWRAAALPLTTDFYMPRMSGFTMYEKPQILVDAEWVRAHLEDPEVVLIDARPLDEYTGANNGMNGQFLAGHIPGARHLDWQELLYSTEDPRLLPIEELRARFEAAGAHPDKLVVAYCHVGMRASLIYFVSKMLGYETRLYDGSWVDWSARNFPVETGADPHVSR